MTLVCNVVGARPNFMKMAPVVLELKRRGIPQFLVHTGQHYDEQMSNIFFEELGLPQPDIDLGIGSGSHADQTARIMLGIEPVLVEKKPNLVIVGGDVNSTLACALVAAKLGIPVAHIEAGLRSFDRSMPEEINRVLTDHLSDLLFVTEPSGGENLLREGIAPGKIHFVGNCMIDSLHSHLDKALAREPWRGLGLEPQQYGIVTLHRPSNVDDIEQLSKVMSALVRVGEKLPLVFPVHPRTAHQLDLAIAQNSRGAGSSPAGKAARSTDVYDHPRDRLRLDSKAVIIINPLGYLDFLGLMARARLVLTDSGGIQEETTALGVPCLTLRDNTERPITLEQGTNRLVGSKSASILAAVDHALANGSHQHQVPSLWDGHAAQRIVDVIENWFRLGMF